MKHFFALMLVFVTLFCLCAHAETVPEEDLILTREYPGNIMMEQTGDRCSDPLFGNESYTHEDVTSVTFLDTLADAPGSAWDISLNGDGSVMAWMDDGALYIAGEGGVTASSCFRMFSGFYEVTEIYFNDCFYTDISKSMRQMFQRCYKLEEIDLSFFRTANVIDMNAVFVDCTALTELDASSFDTSNTLRMDDMFYNCYMLTDLNISSFNTANVRLMWSMFTNCRSLTTLDLSHFDTSKVEDLAQMFYHCENLESVILSSFRTPKCEYFHCMFEGCPKLTSLDMSGFDFSNAKKAQRIFMGCTSLTDINRTISLPEGCLSDNMYTDSGLQ